MVRRKKENHVQVVAKPDLLESVGPRIRHMREHFLRMTQEEFAEAVNRKNGVITETLAQEIIDGTASPQKYDAQYALLAKAVALAGWPKVQGDLSLLEAALYHGRGGKTQDEAIQRHRDDIKKYLADADIKTAAQLVACCEEYWKTHGQCRDGLRKYQLSGADIAGIESGGPEIGLITHDNDWREYFYPARFGSSASFSFPMILHQIYEDTNPTKKDLPKELKWLTVRHIGDLRSMEASPGGIR